MPNYLLNCIGDWHWFHNDSRSVTCASLEKACFRGGEFGGGQCAVVVELVELREIGGEGILSAFFFFTKMILSIFYFMNCLKMRLSSG